MMVNWCKICRGAKTTGWIPRWNWLVEEIRWSFPSLLKYVVKDCKACGGDGYAKPPGWPDEKEMKRLRPSGWKPRPSMGNFGWYDRPKTELPRMLLRPVPPKTRLIREGCTKPIQE